jgi:VanZ family protein
MISFVKNWWLTIIALLTFAWLTLAPHPLPDNDVGMWFEGVDKVVHALMLWGITCAVIFDYKRSGKRLSLRPVAVIAVSVMLLSVVDEWAQSAMNIGRTGDVLDLAADAVGIVVGLVTAPPIVNKILKRIKKSRPE